MIRKLTPQERWELSRHTEYEALYDGLVEAARECALPMPVWLYNGIAEAIEKEAREVVWHVPITDRRVR